MFRRILAILLALCVLFGAVLCFADEWDDDDDWDDDDLESFDDEYETEEQQSDFKSVSTYNIATIAMDDFSYKLNEDGTGAILTSYIGEDSEVVFPSSVNDDIPVIEIDTGMCADNPKLVNITIPGSIKKIGNNAFARCPKLKTVVLEEGVENIGMCSFGGCPELTDVRIPDSLIKVDVAGFAYCAALEEIAFGSGLQEIQMQAFAGCASLTKVTVPGENNVVLGDRIFDQCPNEPEIIQQTEI